MKKLRITVDGRAYDVAVEELADDGVANSNGAPAVVPPLPMPKVSAPAAAAPAAAAPAAASPSTRPAANWPTRSPASGGKDVVSQISGMVIEVDVAVGATVTEGQRLVTIEAMKMNTYVLAPFAGTVTEVLAAKGKSVLAGDVLARLS